MHKLKPTKLNQGGFASIVIALILIIVLSLLTVGFAQLARREQQNALNKQLARQAYYAAETGINDVSKLLEQGVIDDNNDMCPFPTAGFITKDGQTIKNTIDINTGVSYSCAIIKTKLPELIKSPISPNTAWTTIFTTDPAPAQQLRSFVINWSSANPNGKSLRTQDSGFTPAASWNSPAVLQVSITPLGAGDRNSLIKNTFTVYLYPSTGAFLPPFASYTPGGAVRIVSGQCAFGGGGCAVTINNLDAPRPGAVAGEAFLVHTLVYYDTSDITLTTARSITNGTLTFNGAQAQIDVTGRARDVLKRLQVRVPLNGTNADAMPDYGIEAQDICKRFTTAPTTVGNPNGTEFISPTSPFGVVSSGACALN